MAVREIKRWALLDIVAAEVVFVAEEDQSRHDEFGMPRVHYRELDQPTFGIVCGPLNDTTRPFFTLAAVGIADGVQRQYFVRARDLHWIEDSPLCRYGYNRSAWIGGR